MNGEMMRKGTGYEFDVLADRYGFGVVYPDGYENNWNDCRRTAAYPAKRLNIDDMSFLRAIIQRFRVVNGSAEAPVFAVGYSDGGEMAHRLAMRPPGKLRPLPLSKPICLLRTTFSVRLQVSNPEQRLSAGPTIPSCPMEVAR
jgi:polyhydroxybutyrate depolymerase